MKTFLSMQKLKQRWGITSNFQLGVIIVVFAVNGSLSARLGLFVMKLLGLTKETLHVLGYYLIATILILPIYPFVIMVIGWIFGQSAFFIPFAKKMLHTISFGLLYRGIKKRAG